MKNKVFAYAVVSLLIGIGTISVIPQEARSAIPTADLEVGNLHAVTSTATSGNLGCRWFSVTVYNHGPDDVPSCRVRWYIDDEIALAYNDGPSIDAGDSVDIHDQLCTSPGWHEVRVEVYPPVGYKDPDTTNNWDQGTFFFP
jgi:hypothetical protein